MKAGRRTFVPRSLPETPTRQGIHDVPVFLSLIQHERSRVDRDGKEFALAIFKTDGLATWNAGAIIDRIGRCMRDIDEAGWIDGMSIGVLLPFTSMDGGHRFACRVAGRELASEGIIPFRVYSYPRHWVAADPDSPAGGLGLVGDEPDDPSALRSVFTVKPPFWKRGIDLLGSLIGLVLLSPLFAAVALYIKAVSPGPVLFRQDRIGLGGKTFTFYKFRTMKADNDQSAHRDHILMRMQKSGASLDKLDDRDPRIYRGGKFLRKSCIDELPQLLNVLKGDMSLVGPRPCLPYEADVFLRWHRRRFDVLPGMTGLWQVSGKNHLSFIQMIRLDISYARSLSLGNDILILLRTFPAIAKLLMESGQPKGRAQTVAAHAQLYPGDASPASLSPVPARAAAPLMRPLGESGGGQPA